MRILKAVMAVLLMSQVSPGFSAEDNTVAGVVTHVNKANQTITVRNDADKVRRTYFLSENTRLLSGGEPIVLSQIKPGNSVSLRSRATDSGHEIVTFRVPNLDEIVDIIPVEMTSEYTVSGTVTGVRTAKRTITIREDETRERLTLKIPNETRISRDGSAISLNKIQAGNQLAARYLVTDQGLILVTGRSPKVAPGALTQQSTLPKTAGNLYAYLLLGLGLLGAAGATHLLRQRLAA